MSTVLPSTVPVAPITTLGGALTVLHYASPADLIWAANALMAMANKAKVPAVEAVPAKPAAPVAPPAPKPAVQKSTPGKTPVAPVRPVALPSTLPTVKVSAAKLAKVRRDTAGLLRFAVMTGDLRRLPSQAAISAYDMIMAHGGTESAVQAAVAKFITVA